MKIGILGSGAYSIALSGILIDNGCKVTMWSKHNKTKDDLNKVIKNYELHNEIIITNNIELCVEDKDLIIIAIPAAFIDELAISLKPYINQNHILIATKGIEQETGLFIDEIISKHLNTKNIAIISGPTFAVDMIDKMPLGLTLASKSKQTISIAKRAFENNYLKMTETNDVIGTEICGAIKNVMAIAAGILVGLKGNSSTSAMFLTEVINDIMKIIEAFGGNKETIISFAGVGDILLTCTNEKSRNFSFGKLIGERKSQKEINEYTKSTTIEGYYTLQSIYKLLKDKKIEIPTINLIYDIVIKHKNPNKLLTFIVEKK